MKVQQENIPFRPITIKLENKSEATALFGLIDKIEAFRSHQGAKLELTPDEIKMTIDLSNINTNFQVRF